MVDQHRTNFFGTATVALALMICPGCDSSEEVPPPAATPQTTKAPPPAPPSAPSSVASETADHSTLTAPDKSKPAQAPAQATPAGSESESPTTVRQKAEFGVGARGHDYQPGVITTPMSVYFSTGERMVFNVQLPKAMQLFKATENRAPKSEKEFMEKIVKDNGIKLPELPPGHRYVYDPKQGELMVEQPAR